ncbi:hypothetical protein Gotur_024709 [Gossypium turneri]
MTPEAVEIMVRLLNTISLVLIIDSSVHIDDIDNRIITFWVLKGMVEFDFKNLLLTHPNILDLARNNICRRGVKLKLKFRG